MVKRKRTKAEEDSSVDPTARSFIYDVVDDFNNIDQDDPEDNDEYEYQNVAKVISNNKRKEQVLGLDLSSSDESEVDEDDDDFRKDIQSSESDDDDFKKDIQSSESSDDDASEEDYRSLGKRKRDYFGTDITDTRLHNASKQKKKQKQEKDEEALKIELEMALEMQRRLGKYKEPYRLIMDDEEPSVKVKKLESKDAETSKKLKAKEQQAKELAFQDAVKEKCNEVIDLLSPLIENGLKKHLLPECQATEYLKTKYYISMNYFLNVMARRLLQQEGEDVAEHPVAGRIAQFHYLFKELDRCKPKYEPQLRKMLEDLNSGKLKKESKKLLGIIKNNKKQKNKKETTVEEKKKPKGEMETDDDEDEEMNDDVEQGNEEAETDADGRRLISYEIAKNKGLMPSRKKKQRNPRVKYKKKYQNKLKRRKGQVREVRKELHRYAGESSGIKTNVIKSIKFK